MLGSMKSPEILKRETRMKFAAVNNKFKIQTEGKYRT